MLRTMINNRNQLIFNKCDFLRSFDIPVQLQHLKLQCHSSKLLLHHEVPYR